MDRLNDDFKGGGFELDLHRNNCKTGIKAKNTIIKPTK